MKIEITKKDVAALKWLLIKGMEITNSKSKYDIFDDMYEKICKSENQ